MLNEGVEVERHRSRLERDREKIGRRRKGRREKRIQLDVKVELDREDLAIFLFVSFDAESRDSDSVLTRYVFTSSKPSRTSFASSGNW